LKIKLYTDPPEFHIFASKIDKAILFVWTAETSVKNYTWMRIIVIKLTWPPIRHVEAFVKEE